MSRQLISEVLEKDATGEIARIYAEIRRLWGVSNVTTIVRHVASVPGVLEWYWSIIGPANACGDFQETALGMVDTLATEPLQPLPDLALRAMGVDASAKAQIQDVYGAYDRNNRPNLLFVSILQRLLRSATGKSKYEPQRTNWALPETTRPLVRMVQADEMPPETLALAQAVGSWGFPEGSAFLPGVYRHLANWPAYLAHVGALMWPYLETGEILRAGTSIVAAADAVADELVSRLPSAPEGLAAPTPEQAAEMSELLSTMTQKIPEMIVICKLLGDALPGEEKGT
ncbi:MAG: hypothetical protein QGH07_08625 [Alphaproteobacteria bacterium]|nr:hypothetical protein [Alphaproteobacteria bacterium]